jgi:hypothetical protein
MNPLNVPSSSGVQPMTMDANGDMKIDLLGLVPGSSSSFKIWQNVYNSTQPQSPPFNVCVIRDDRVFRMLKHQAAQTLTSTALPANSRTHTATLSSTSTATVSQVRLLCSYKLVCANAF